MEGKRGKKERSCSKSVSPRVIEIIKRLNVEQIGRTNGDLASIYTEMCGPDGRISQQWSRRQDALPFPKK